MFVNIIEVLKDNAIKYSDKIAIEDENNSLSWKELDESSDKIARFFLKMGYEKGCHIGLSGKNFPRYFKIWWYTYFIKYSAKDMRTKKNGGAL